MRHSPKYLIFLFLLSFSSSFLLVHSVSAYTVLGKKWPNANAHYSIDASYSNQGPGWNGRANNAINSWNAIGNTPFRFLANGGDGDNHVQAGDPSCSANNPPCLAGTVRFTNGNAITQFLVIINVFDGYSFYDGTQAPTIPTNYYDLESATRHELGHALGLCHSARGNLMAAGFAAGTLYPIDKDSKKGDRFLYNPNYTGVGPEGPCF